MHERELKKECIDVAREMKQTQRGREAESTETKWVRRNVRRVFWRFEWNWAEVGLVLSKTVRSGFFFFFFFEFLPESAVSADTADSGPSRLALARVEAVSARVGENHMAWRGRTRGQRRPLCVAASDAGVAPLVPRPCFPALGVQLGYGRNS